MLHKNVTEEYKTDQFLHVIYWFLIYKSNLGHFFRNEGIFFPPSSSSSPTNFFVHRPHQLVRCPRALPPPGCGHTRAHVWHMLLPSCRCTCVLGNRSPWVERVEWSLLHRGGLPLLKLQIWAGGQIRGPGVWHLAGLAPLGSYLSGLFSLGLRPAS